MRLESAGNIHTQGAPLNSLPTEHTHPAACSKRGRAWACTLLLAGATDKLDIVSPPLGASLSVHEFASVVRKIHEFAQTTLVCGSTLEHGSHTRCPHSAGTPEDQCPRGSRWYVLLSLSKRSTFGGWLLRLPSPRCSQCACSPQKWLSSKH